MYHRVMFAVFVLVVLVGCAGTGSLKHASSSVTDNPDSAYQRSVRMLTAKGALLSMNDAQMRIVQGHVRGTMIVTMEVRPMEGGSHIEVRCQVPMGTLTPVLGSCDPEEFLRAYQQTR